RGQRAPRGPVRRGSVEAGRYLVQQRAGAAEVDLLVTVVEAEVERAPHERGHDLGPDAVDQPVERRAGGERREKCLMVGDLVADVPEIGGAQIEQLAAAESVRVDAVRHVSERPALAAELVA